MSNTPLPATPFPSETKALGSASVQRPATPSYDHYRRWATAMAQAHGVLGGLLAYKKNADWLEVEQGLSAALKEMRPFSTAAHVAELLAASGMSASGQDAEERLEAKPASPTAESGDALSKPYSETD